MLNSDWYEPAPTRTLDSFRPNEKYKDDFFPLIVIL